MIKKCFVIQPFDGGVFDKRYRDIFKPAIEDAGFEAYRVDEDLSVRIPIEDIEKNIENSDICFAEITTDNPNVWYELGYAFACKKDVILVCQSSERKKFPFDIQHRHIISYESTSPSDFDKLKRSISKKIKALSDTERKIENLIENPVRESEGLKPHEITLMIMIMTQQLTEYESVSVYSLRNDMVKAGFTDAASSLAIRNLKRRGMIDLVQETDYQGNEYPSCKLTTNGEEWIIKNQDFIQIRKKPKDSSYENDDDVADDVPF